MKTLLTAIYNLLASSNPVLYSALGVFTLILTLNSYVNEMWSSAFAKIDTLSVNVSSSVNFSPLGLIDYCFPLSEMLTLMVTYGGIRVLCAGIRIIKSWIPTVS